MKIAVLGATGMIGQHVLRAGFARGHAMVAVSRRMLADSTPHDARLEARLADLANVPDLKRALAGVDAVIHCAGYYPGPPRPLREEVETARVLSQNFYEACAEHTLQKIVYVGAAIAFPRNQDGTPSDGQRSFPGKPATTNSYLQVKWLQDQLALDHAKQGLPVVIGIPAMTFGEFDPGNTTGRFILGLARGEFKAFVDGKRNVIYAGDAAHGLILAAESGHPGRRYLFTGENLHMSQLMARIATITHSPMPKAAPLAATKVLHAWQLLRYKFFSGSVPTISDGALAVMAGGQFLDGRIAAEDLGYKAEVSIEDAIQRAVTWFVQQGMLKAP